MPATALFQSPATIIADLRRWMRDDVLPFWYTSGFKSDQGSFYETLQLDGTSDQTAILRLRTQARQIYVYSHAAHLGWYTDGLTQALQAFDFMQRQARSPDGAPGYVHLLTPQGGIANPLRDTYDHAFLLLAFCWLAKATGEARVHAALAELVGFIDSHLTAADGSLHEGIPPSQPRRQNPHMHMFEALLAWHETLGDPSALPRAQRILDLMKTRFVDGETRTLGEYFSNDWTLLPGTAGDSIEPGHQAEWVWLLRRHARLSGQPAGHLPAQLLSKALRNTDGTTGLLIDEADRFHAPRKASRRTWPQTELAKAWIAEAEAGVSGAADSARQALHTMARHYFGTPIRSGWMDQFDADGRPIATTIPASTLYHIFVAVTEADRVLQQEHPGDKPA